MAKRLTKLQVAHQQVDDLKLIVKGLRAELEVEQIRRVSAQRGLVAYMKEHGLGDRIGYDPDQDESLNPLLKAMA
jgi:hypothetical protein